MLRVTTSRVHGQLLSGPPRSLIIFSQNRAFGMFVARVLKNVLKIRYIILGGGIAGGVSLHQSYESWRDSLPDTQWLKDIMPPPEKLDSWHQTILEFKDKMTSIEIDPRLKSLPAEQYENFRAWFDQRLENATKAAEIYNNNNTESTANFFKTSGIMERLTAADMSMQQRVENLQEELIKVQLKYQREIERLEKENRDLRKTNLLRGKSQEGKRAIKKSLIDMYSEVLDELSEYDSSYKSADHLPRVIVVGDQSSGKTSVLEMVAKARIFPRGAGEMMTRAPVKVTLSEGPYHIAQFKDSNREFDLTKESDLIELRKEVELKMKNSVRDGKTISNEVISMTVKGPGLSRIVLVDLPGVISTQTVDMADDTKESIINMSKLYMSNPNAIILCIQDGSVDAERSNVTDLVAQMDPQGKRTIFVLTKVDLAEENFANPERIQKILSGKLFPMKALGYFAVVTGRGNTNDTIEQIRNYEEQFFTKSKIFKSGKIGSTQVTTKNLSFAVGEIFWKMVKETVEQQADGFKALRFNLETEWKNNFPRTRELDREELFEKARGEILDEVINLSQVSAKEWEELLMNKLWESMSVYVFENVFLPAAQSGNSNTFNTTVDIRLKQWAETQLPSKCVEVGFNALKEKFWQFLNSAKAKKDHDSVFDDLKKDVVEEAMKRHAWEDKAPEVLRVIQLNTLEDRAVHDKYQWDNAVKFLEEYVRDRLRVSEEMVRTLVGPGFIERWTRWQSSSEAQCKRSQIKADLDQLLMNDPKHGPLLSSEESTVLRKNLENRGFKVDHDTLRETWFPIYRKHFLKSSLAKSFDCRKGYWIYSKGVEGDLDCNEVVLFWRIQQMLRVTANALRQQVVNREARRLEREIKEVLEDYSQDKNKIVQLLTGKRVQLAEDLKKVRQIQERLEEFIQALNTEK